MKRIYYLVIVIFCNLCFASCEKVDQVELKDASEKYVIEANLSNQLGSLKVAIGKTKSTTTSTDFTGESGAIITLTDENGKSVLLKESSQGIYVNPTFKGVPETTYALKVEINGETFTATSKMPAITKFEMAECIEIAALDGKRKVTHVRFKDPIGKGNCYRFIEYRNGVYNKVISVFNDDLFDGNTVNQILRPKDFKAATKYVTGDEIKVEFLTIDQPVYRYWFCKDGGIENISDASASINPVSNIKGGALGYFSAHTFQKKVYVIKD